MNGTAAAIAGGARRGEPRALLVGGPQRVAAGAAAILEIHADGAGVDHRGDRIRHVCRRRTVAALDIGADRHRDRPRDPRHRGDRLLTTELLAVGHAQRP
jgi:hypothetical protein